MAFPAYYGVADTLSDEEKAARGPGMHVAVAPPLIQELFNLNLRQIALRTGYKDAAHYVKEGLDGVVYHYTLNFMGGHTIVHTDEPKNDGPGWWIWNLVLQISGLLYFLDHWERANGVQLPMSAVWQETGDCVGFSGDARIYMGHGVLREMGTLRLPGTKEELGDDPSWRQRARMVSTIRGGLLPPEREKQWDKHHEVHYGLVESPLPKKGAPRKTKKVAKMKIKVEAPRASPRLANVTTTTTTPTTSSSAASAPTISGALVPASQAHLPQIGAVLNVTNQTYGTCTVLGVCSNFVVTNVVSPRKAITLQAGTQFKVRLLPLDDRVTVVDVLLVGEIYAGNAGSKYRAAVVKCKRGNGGWGGLETLEATAFPIASHCEVVTHTTEHIGKHTIERTQRTLRQPESGLTQFT